MLADQDCSRLAEHRVKAGLLWGDSACLLQFSQGAVPVSVDQAGEVDVVVSASRAWHRSGRPPGSRGCDGCGAVAKFEVGGDFVGCGVGDAERQPEVDLIAGLQLAGGGQVVAGEIRILGAGGESDRPSDWLKRIENGQRGVSISALLRLARVLRVDDLSTFIDGDVPIPVSAWEGPRHPAATAVCGTSSNLRPSPLPGQLKSSRRGEAVQRVAAKSACSGRCGCTRGPRRSA